MGIASKGPRIVLRELRRGCTVSGQEFSRIDRELVFRKLSGIDSVVTGFDPNSYDALNSPFSMVASCFLQTSCLILRRFLHDEKLVLVALNQLINLGGQLVDLAVVDAVHLLGAIALLLLQRFGLLVQQRLVVPGWSVTSAASSVA
ncbi:hypothetical protein F2Q68_00038950 [Brassica cretica]|uniref:Uncharacterized protein n=1 Tax=Brassica cretica TaxID=69181 RepID=A0A3N6RBN3_BRACR|nr:hypothetical protein F2Q68_00038950 [Brassica cretica]